jgi:hypothetical protein
MAQDNKIVSANTPVELAQSVYDKMTANVAVGRKRLGRSMTLAEKILFGHMRTPDTDGFDRGVTYGEFSLTESLCKMPRHKWRCCSS